MRTRIPVFIFGCCALLLLTMCRKATDLPASQYDERISAGNNTVFDATSQAFSSPFPGLSAYDMQTHILGDDISDRTFVSAPAPINSGLGPVYNNVSCKSCHHNDGIGVPTAGSQESSLLVRISLPGVDAHGGDMPVPGYGTQLQDKAVQGVQPECTINIQYTEQNYSFADGTTYQLRAPTYTLSNLYTAISGNYMLSPRLAPPLYGLGLLEAIPESAIVANADPNDANGDGISGKANYVWDPTTNSQQLGRFGLKANTASILTQVAAAFVNDMGITNKIFPQEACYGQPQYDGLHDDPELPDSLLNAVKYYVQTLCVPARRNVTDPQVMQGKKIFMAAQCGSCHIETFTTATNMAFPEASNQVIHPYTDMLMHDMGPGLADNRPDYLANGQEWRTSPLWGIGLFATVNYPAYFLHDGRARTIIEAIMWHGGEAQQSTNYIKQLSTQDRNALIAFLQSL